MVYMITEDVGDIEDGYINIEYSKLCKEFFEENYTIDDINGIGKYYFYNIMNEYDSITGVKDSHLSDYDIILIS